VSWSVRFTKQAQKDARKLAAASPALKAKAEQLLQLLAEDPFRQPPPYEALVGDLRGAFSRRLNIQHRLVYQVLREEKIVKVLRLWTHYEWGLRRKAAPEAPHTGDLLATAAITGGSEDQTQFS
jgi:Txe/YoeB family toxin of toxin-antitoxin system